MASEGKLYALTCYHQSDDSNLIRLFTSLDKARWEFNRTIREINDEGARQPEEAEQFDDSKSFKKCIKHLDYESCDSRWTSTARKCREASTCLQNTIKDSGSEEGG